MAVGNTLKRTVIILAALVVFQEAMKPVAAAGTAVAVPMAVPMTTDMAVAMAMALAMAGMCPSPGPGLALAMALALAWPWQWLAVVLTAFVLPFLSDTECCLLCYCLSCPLT